MNCKEFEEKIYGIDDLSNQERLEVLEHLNQCTHDHAAVEWIVEELKFSSPAPANPGQLTANIMDAVATAGRNRTRHIGNTLLRYAAALMVFALSAAFAWEITRTPLMSDQRAQITKSESNAAFIKRIRQKPKTLSLIAEIRACRTKCKNPLVEGCDDCMDLLNNLNNNSK